MLEKQLPLADRFKKPCESFLCNIRREGTSLVQDASIIAGDDNLSFGHSYRRASTGFAEAAFKIWMLMVSSAIRMASPPDRINGHRLMDVL